MRATAAFVLPLLLVCCGAPIDPAQREWIPDQDSPPGELVADPEEKSAPATVVFYNVENLFDTEDDPRTNDNDFLPTGKLRWTEERYRRKLERLSEAIGMSGKKAPYLIGLAEVENRRVVEDLSRTGTLAHGRYAVVHEDSPDPRGIDVALLVSGRFGRVTEQRFLPVDLEAGGVTRPVLHAIVETTGGQRVHVFVNHWPSRRAGEKETVVKRKAAARVLRGALDDVFAGAERAHVIVMGDFNDGPLDGSVRQGLGAAVKPTEPGADLVNLIARDTIPPVGSISHGGTWDYFDQVLVSRALLDTRVPGQVRASSAASIKDRRLIFHHPKYGDQPNRTFSGTKYHKDGYSDHLPVVLRLE